MKSTFLQFVAMLSIAFFSSCNNENEISKEMTNEDYSHILDEAQPYISSGMQKLINKLDTATTPPVIEEVIPSIENLLNNDSLINSPKISTRVNVDGTTVTYGYSATTILFNKKAVTISNNGYSALRESLGYTYKFDSSSEVIYLTCRAVCNYVYFAQAVSFAPAYALGDLMGVNPDGFNADVTDDSALSLGYHCDEKVANRLYYFTTYLFEVYVYTNGGCVCILPMNSASLNYLGDYCNELEWRYYAL